MVAQVNSLGEPILCILCRWSTSLNLKRQKHIVGRLESCGGGDGGQEGYTPFSLAPPHLTLPCVTSRIRSSYSSRNYNSNEFLKCPPENDCIEGCNLLFFQPKQILLAPVTNKSVGHFFTLNPVAFTSLMH